ncbi:MAG: amidohydrolase [Planctomycetes bacterium]|nr:amidohydrolase [Planctomycetota bacterium]
MTIKGQSANGQSTVALVLFNGSMATMDRAAPRASAIAISGGRFIAVGDDANVLRLKGLGTRVIDLGGRTVIPGLNDSHLHVIRGGLNFNLELRWDGVPSLADAMRMLRVQVQQTPAPQWVRVVGGFCEFQFKERRLPTLAELNEAAPDTPVFILHLYDRALLNRAALRAVGYTKDTLDPPGGIIERDKTGQPTGLLLANPNAWILYKTLALGPKLPPEYQYNSTRHFLRDLNRLGVTSCGDAGGGFQNYPQDYEIIQQLQQRGELNVRIAYNLFTQRPKAERDDFVQWTTNSKYQQGDDFLRLNGAGEMLVYSAADFEDFRVSRPDMPQEMESELREVVRVLAKNRWPFRLHATYEQTISRALAVFEEVNREFPIGDLRWFFDHCETVSDRSLERIKSLGGGIAIQDRMAFQGEYFVERYGAQATQRTPPIRQMLDMGIPVGAGTDATRVSSYNPWVSLWWLVSGKSLGGATLYDDSNRMSREEALRLFTIGSAWFSRDENKKGIIAPGHFADVAVISDDLFSVPEDRIKSIESVLTIVNGKIVYGDGPFKQFDLPPLPVMPDWSPVAKFGGAYSLSHHGAGGGGGGAVLAALSPCANAHAPFGSDGLGCSCFAF